MFSFPSWRWSALALLLAIPQSALAYAFPYADPFYATITTAILKADHLDRTLKYEDITIKLIPARGSVPYFGESRNFISARFWNTKKEGPLVVLVAGLGGSSGATYANFLASKFVKKGIHVLVLPSPFHYTFALAASRSGVPGISRNDALDLSLALEDGLRKARKRSGFKFNRLGLMGVSMGALEAAYLSELDAKEKKFQFERTLLINPPLDPLYSAKEIDQLGKEGAALSDEQKSRLKEKVILFGSQALLMKDINSPDYFTGIEERLPTTDQERKFLIGSSMKDFLQGLVFATQQVNDLGVLKTPIATDNADARLAEAEQLSFHDYLDLILLPTLSRAAGRPVTFEEKKNDVLLSGIETHLRNSPSVHLMHNKDDFIVNDSQIKYLQSVFGPRFTLYPHGGHVGNIWYTENLEAIISNFSPLANP